MDYIMKRSCLRLKDPEKLQSSILTGMEIMRQKEFFIKTMVSIKKFIVFQEGR
jgi:hypothetical protein